MSPTMDRSPRLDVDYFGQEHNQTHRDVLVWQGQMAWRGWTLVCDQIFGPESESVARAFQELKDLEVDGLVGPDTWDETWESPVDQDEIDAFREHAGTDSDEPS